MFLQTEQCTCKYFCDIIRLTGQKGVFSMEKIIISAFADEASGSLDGQINAMLDNDVSGLEIRNVNGKNVSDLTPSEAKEIRNRLEEKGLFTYSIGSPIGKISICTFPHSWERK